MGPVPEAVSSMSLQLGDYAVIGGMFTAFAGVFITVMHANLKAITRRIEVVETRVGEFEEKKVTKKDWLRVEFSTRQKVDVMSEKLTALNSRLEADWGMGAAIGRLADSVNKMVEKRDG